MKKRPIRYNWIHCRKWIATWTVLVLVFSLISVSAGSDSYTERAGSGNYTYLKIITDTDEQSEENTEGNLKVEEDPEDDAGNQETDIENPENRAEESGKTRDQISTTDDRTSEEDSGIKTETEQDTNTQKNNEKDPEVQTGEKIEPNKDTQENTEEDAEVRAGSKDDISSQKNTQESPETKVTAEMSTDIHQNTDNEENPEKNRETEKIDSCSTDNLKSTCKVPAPKKGTEEKPECQKNPEAAQKLKTNKECGKDGFENPGTEIGMRTGSCDGLKTIEIVKVETGPDREACSGTTNSKSEGLESGTTIEVSNEENFAGAYEKGTDPEGVARTEEPARDVKRTTRAGIKQKSYTILSTEGQDPSILKTEQSVLDSAGLLGLKGLEPQFRIESIQAAEAVKKPSKLASFLVTFAGTLLIGFTMLRRRY
ncbi:hypothetical protein RSJ42_07440 [Methanosarcina hadiensis]|uniref:hypothetical protein n=1 Tax=Methanosarcina hadiensis TaxID=3078083 RepID=UPI0039774B5D